MQCWLSNNCKIELHPRRSHLLKHPIVGHSIALHSIALLRRILSHFLKHCMALDSVASNRIFRKIALCQILLRRIVLLHIILSHLLKHCIASHCCQTSQSCIMFASYLQQCFWRFQFSKNKHWIALQTLQANVFFSNFSKK